MYIIFALFCGLLGSLMSVILRLELSAPGNQILMGNHQLFNAFATAHAILMSTPMCLLFVCSVIPVLIIINYQLKRLKDGGIEFHVEKQTSKFKLKGIIFKIISELKIMEFTLRNLILLKDQYGGLHYLECNDSIISHIIRANKDNLDHQFTESEIINSKKLHDISQIKGTLGLPKGSLVDPNKLSIIKIDNVYNVKNKNYRGNGGLVVPLCNIMERGPAIASNIRSYSTQVVKDGVQKDFETFSDININKIGDIKNLVTAYETIKSRPGNMTPGTDGETLSGINIKYLENISNSLLKGTFNFSSGRLVEIPKADNKGTRSLVIASPRDKIVQQAIKQILEPYYETTFNEFSYGFRPNRGINSAIFRLDGIFQNSK